jgi:sarcosine oxidase subunit gamma
VTHAYRSLLDTTHKLASAHWQRHGDARIISHFGQAGKNEERVALKQLACMDLSPLPRYGLKGCDINASLPSMGLHAGEPSNRAYPQSDGSLIARLAPAELLILANPLRPAMALKPAAMADQYECYRVRRQDSHYWFALIGEKSSKMLAKLCGVDFNPMVFKNHRLAQTQVARTSAIIVRSDLGVTPAYYLLGDSSCVTYMWDCLREAMLEFEGRFIGARAILGRGDRT